MRTPPVRDVPVGEEPYAWAIGVTLSRRRRAWLRCLQVTRIQHLLFFLDCSVPLTRGRVGWLYRVPLPPEAWER